MIRKMLFVIILMAALIGTSGSGPALAKTQPLPTFEKVFTPPTVEGQTIYFVLGPTVYRSAMYLTESATPTGGRIWRSFDGKNWMPVTDWGFGLGAKYTSSWDMTVFKDKLYVPVNCFDSVPNCDGVLLRTSNGKDWEKITLDTKGSNLDKLGIFNGTLYATTVNPGGQIMRSRSGDAGTWEVVHGFDPMVISTSSPTAYKGKLYISGYESTDSAIIWSSADGKNWETSYLKLTNNTDIPSDFLWDGELNVYHGNLYLTTHNWLDGGQIFRTSDGKNWNLVFQGAAGDRITGILGNITPYEGDLYVGSVFFDINTEEWGGQIWRSHSGDPGTWEKITNDEDWQTVWFERCGTGIFQGHLYLTDSGSVTGLYRMDK